MAGLLGGVAAHQGRLGLLPIVIFAEYASVDTAYVKYRRSGAAYRHCQRAAKISRSDLLGVGVGAIKRNVHTVINRSGLTRCTHQASRLREASPFLLQSAVGGYGAGWIGAKGWGGFESI